MGLLHNLPRIYHQNMTVMNRVKVIGAGSIGNHLTNAARRLGWQVDLCDIDQAALERARDSIYPGRYGQWDDDIGLFLAADAPIESYDLICIGTPPDSHMELAIKALEENPRALLVEKPLCGPGLDQAQELLETVENSDTRVFVGYDHVVGEAVTKTRALAGSSGIGPFHTMDVEFREYWGGIFAAHPWLDGPADSYLGYWQRGGGAAGEHSHAINLWQHLALAIGVGRVKEVSATADYVNDGTVEYDQICAFNLKTETGFMGRVIQDVVTSPTRKWGRLQGRNGFLELHIGVEPGRDQVDCAVGGEAPQDYIFNTTRPGDFIAELEHIRDVLDGKIEASPIALERGLETMLVIAAAHKSAQSGRTVKIDYDKGYRSDALL
jgi:predicted dehydrogenase